jgi:predicted DNA-binding transcriptional regulator AlpA
VSIASTGRSEWEAGEATTRRAYSINEFLQAYRISRSALYNMWKDGTGPRSFKVGSKVLISTEAAEAWRRAREAAA